MVAIPKGNNHTSTSKYRPISLLSVLRKLLEKHIHLTSHLESHHPIALQQWGFQAIRSTVSALLDIFHNWSKALDQGLEVCAVFLTIWLGATQGSYREVEVYWSHTQVDLFAPDW